MATLGKPRRDGVERKDNHQLDKDHIGNLLRRGEVHLGGMGGGRGGNFSKHIDTILN